MLATRSQQQYTEVACWFLSYVWSRLAHTVYRGREASNDEKIQKTSGTYAMLSTMSRLSTSWVEELNFVRAGLALPSYEFELGLKIGGCS